MSSTKPQQTADVLAVTPSGLLRSFFVVNNLSVPLGVVAESEPAPEVTEQAKLDLKLIYNPNDDAKPDILVQPSKNAVLTLVWNVGDKAQLKEVDLSAHITVSVDNPLARIAQSHGDMMFYRLFTTNVYSLSVYSDVVAGISVVMRDDDDEGAKKTDGHFWEFDLVTNIPRGYAWETLYVPRSVRKLI